MAAILDVDELFARMAQLVKRVIDFRTFGVFLLNAESDLLEAKLRAVRQSRGPAPRANRRGPGRVAALHQELGAGARLSADALHQGGQRRGSELVVPMLLKDRLHRRARPPRAPSSTFSKRDIES